MHVPSQSDKQSSVSSDMVYATGRLCFIMPYVICDSVASSWLRFLPRWRIFYFSVSISHGEYSISLWHMFCFTVAALNANDMWDNTLLVFSSDNGGPTYWYISLTIFSRPVFMLPAFQYFLFVPCGTFNGLQSQGLLSKAPPV